MGNKLVNGSLRVVTGVLTGAVLILADGLGTTFISSFAKAADTVSRPDVLEIIDREIGHVNAHLKRIEGKLDRLIDKGGE